MRTEYTPLIKEVAARYHLDADFLEAQILVESGGRTDAFRHEPDFWNRYMKNKAEWRGSNPRRVASSYGLLQILYTTAKELGFSGAPEMLFVPEIGLDWGAHFLRTLIDWAEGDLVKAFVAYNGGKGSAMKSPYPTRPHLYAEQVLSMKAQLT